MKTLLAALALALAIHTTAAGQDLQAQISPMMGCNSAPDYFVSGVSRQTRIVGVTVNVQNYRLLSDQTVLIGLLNRAAAAGIGQCPANGVVEVFVQNPGNRLLTAWMNRTDGQWRIVNNAIPQMIQQDDARNAQIAAQHQAAADAAQRQAEELAAARAASQRLQSDFKTQTGTQLWVPPEVLKANPFPYKDKVVGMMETFQQMIGDGQAMFGGNFDVIATGVPNTMFTRPGTATILAIQVEGLRQIQILGTNMTVAVGDFKGAYICNSQDCREFIGPH